MLELLINPKKAERKPWEMFFIGAFYGFLSIILAYLIFAKDPVLSKYLSIFVIIFSVIFSMPFVYYTIKLEERKDYEIENEVSLLKEHGKAIMVFLWLFIGFVVAFSIGYMVFPNGEQFFKAQIETFCQINRPDGFNQCIQEYGLIPKSDITGAASSTGRFLAIFSNNVIVLVLTMIFSLIFGAGAIFILAWNASVIAAAIGIFTKSNITQLPLGLGRYLIHGIPEIAAYFTAALAGGIFSTAVIRHDNGKERFFSIMWDAVILLLIAIGILIIAGLIEVFITPKLF
ncbi:MAG: stage II sporulation protein M [archaeon]|nr:stage II sporulation protein M [archaeon]